MNRTEATRREVTHRLASLALSTVLTLSILGSIHLLAVEPAADALMAQHAAPAAVAAASTAPRS